MLGHTAGTLLFLLALWPILEEDLNSQLGPDVAASMLAQDIVRVNDTLRIRDNGQIHELARRSPTLWYIVHDGKRLFAHGKVPAEAHGFIRLLPDLKWAEISGVGLPGLLGNVTVLSVETAAGPVVVAVGGIAPEAVAIGDWTGFLVREGFAVLPLLSALFTLIGGLLAVPLVLRSLKPSVRAAAAIGGADLAQRLPEDRVVKEVRPLVRAVNAALDRLAEGFESRKRFIADVAHELRTPLAVMTMHVDALPSSDIKQQLRRTVFRLGQMVGQMLDAERLALSSRERTLLDLVALGREAVADIAPLALTAGYEIEFSSECDAMPVIGDRHALFRVFSNLLGNAVAHGGGKGTINVHFDNKGRVDIADQGPGIPEEARDRIFEPFHRERRDKDGCGLGLYLVREIMRAHDGDVCSIPTSAGSRFRLQFAAHCVGQDASRT